MDEGNVDRQPAVEDLEASDAAHSRAVSSELLSAVMSLIPDGAVVCDSAGKVVSVNEHAEELFGYPPGFLAGAAIDSLVPDHARDRHEAHRERFFGAPRNRPMGVGLELTGLRRDGSEFPIDISLAPIDHGGEQLVLAAVRDVTEQRRATPVQANLRHMLEEREHLQRQHAATAEIRLALLSGTSLRDSLTLICEKASELVEAPVATICTKNGGEVRIMAGVGLEPEMIDSVLLPGASFAEYVIDVADAVEIGRRTDRSTVEVPSSLPNGPTFGLPIIVGGAPVGSLTFVRELGATGFDPSVRLFAEALAAQAAMAFELERARLDREQLVLAGDRERIARDLHDQVIQRIFSGGMQLQGSLSQIVEPRARSRVQGVIDLLDDVIRDIRTAVFSLSRSDADGDRLRAQVMSVVEESRSVLGFAPKVSFDGPLDSGVPGHVTPEVVASLTEALSNVARHAQASQVHVAISLSDGLLTLQVTDDGVGIGSPTRSSGLSNLADRARLLGGRFTTSRGASGGTRLEWEVPVRD